MRLDLLQLDCKSFNALPIATATRGERGKPALLYKSKVH